MTDQTANIGAKERLFLEALESLFTGAEVEGKSGFVNLMWMKRKHFQSIRPKLLAKIDARTGQDSAFREELFEKIHEFFRRYFCESGSIYFRHLPAFAKIYERVYADGRDVALSWKTRNLYYVKSDVLVRSLPVTVDEESEPQSFFFDVSGIENKQNNERKEFVFEFGGAKSEDGKKVIRLNVSYKKNNGATKTDDILKKSREEGGVTLSEDQLQKAIRVFCRQVEADFFINKNAKVFLREQFDLWMYDYIYKGKTKFTEQRVAKLQAIQDTAYDIIDYIAQFEDELCRVWEKPKFVRKVNYVVTLDKLEKTTGLLKKIAAHKGAEAQAEEWRKLGLVDKKFSIGEISGARGKNQFLPVDTRHFKDLELEILAALGDLDRALDGEFVHGENWQALKTLRKRYAGKVKCIYIDPPFNLDGSDQFAYRTNYKDSCWATMLESRLQLARDFLSDDGGIFVRCDANGNWIVRCLLDSIFTDDNFLNEIIINRTRAKQSASSGFVQKTESLFCYEKKKDSASLIPPERKTDATWNELLHFPRANETPRTVCGRVFYPPPNRRWALSQKRIDIFEERGNTRINDSTYVDCRNQKVTGMPELLYDFEFVGNEWLDLKSYSQSTSFQTENSEQLLQRCVSSFPSESIVLDFFSGSGTTQAVAQKLGRKWLGVEMGDHFKTVILPRMKKVLSGRITGISKETGYKGGGAFKYYRLEQYEDSLRKARYKDSAQLEINSRKSPFEQYVFCADEKHAHVVKQAENGEMSITLDKLFSKIDIAESLANILGKTIRKRTADSVIFAEGGEEKISPAKMSKEEKKRFVKRIRPYLWWGIR